MKKPKVIKKKTILVPLNPNKININKLSVCAELIRKGKLVVFPTETVYGVGANALNKKAIRKIFIAKGRPVDNPLIVHVSDIEMAEKFVEEIPERVRYAMKKFWPGPITFVLKKKKCIPDEVTCGLKTVGIRVPSHKIAKKLIELSNRPIAAPSANLSGKTSPTKAKHVIQDLMGRVDAIIDGGDADVGLESTVLDVSSDIPIILRPGGITFEQIKKIFPNVKIANSFCKKPKCPGMKYKHYAPDCNFILFNGKNEKEKINKIKKERANLISKGMKVAIIGSLETRKSFKEVSDIDFFIVGTRENLNILASKIFNILRKIDSQGYDYILMGTCPSKGIGHAIMNRIEKAASKII